VHLERRADDLLDKVDLRPGEKGQAGLVDGDFGAVALDHPVVGIGLAGESEPVGKARTAPADNPAGWPVVILLIRRAAEAERLTSGLATAVSGIGTLSIRH